jgi:MFS family permease
MMQDNMTDSYSPGWGTRAVMAGGGLLSALALIGIISVLPDIATDLAHGPQDGMLVKQLVGIVSLAMVLGSPLAGFLVDRVGLRRVLITAALVYAVAGTAGLYLDGLKSLVASRFFVGMSAATIQIISFTLINTRLNTQQRARWMGIHVSFAMIGTIIIHPLAGVLGETSWRRPFWLYSIGILVALAALLDRSLDVPAPIVKSPLASDDPVLVPISFYAACLLRRGDSVFADGSSALSVAPARLGKHIVDFAGAYRRFGCRRGYGTALWSRAQNLFLACRLYV